MMVNKGQADHFIGDHWKINYSELAYENGVKLDEKQKQRIIDYVIKLLRKDYKVDNYEGKQTLVVYPRKQNEKVNKNKNRDCPVRAEQAQRKKVFINEYEVQTKKDY
jgi:hypothetical protein